MYRTFILRLCIIDAVHFCFKAGSHSLTDVLCCRLTIYFCNPGVKKYSCQIHSFWMIENTGMFSCWMDHCMYTWLKLCLPPLSFLPPSLSLPPSLPPSHTVHLPVQTTTHWSLWFTTQPVHTVHVLYDYHDSFNIQIHQNWIQPQVI